MVAPAVVSTTTSTGTGSIGLGPALPGYAAWSTLPPGGAISYAIADGDAAEQGWGIWDGTNLTRAVVTFSTADGNPISLSGNNAVVMLTTAAMPLSAIAGGNTVGFTAQLLFTITYNTSEQIAIPPNATCADVIMYGGTGGSGSATATSGTAATGGTGGPGLLRKLLTGLTPGNTLAFVVGGGGAAGVGGAGGNGGASILSSASQLIPTLTAGGSNGTAAATNNVYTAGSAGGTASGGDWNQSGGAGGPAVAVGAVAGLAGQTNYQTYSLLGANGVAVGPGVTLPGNAGLAGLAIISWYNL